MGKKIISAVLLAIFLSMGSAAYAYMETFDSGNTASGTYPGWTTYTIGRPGYPGAFAGAASSWSSTGGDPDGYIFGTVTSGPSDRLYAFEVSGAPYGSLTGQTLSVEYRSTGMIDGPAGANARFYIVDGSLGNYFYSTPWAANTNGSWSTHTAVIDGMGTGFTPGPTNDGTTTFAQVAAHPAWVGVVFSDGSFSTAGLGFTSSTGATIYIDNFGTPSPVPTPLPPAFLLLAPGLAGIAAIRRKCKQ